MDLTDLFVFASPDSPDKTVLIFDVNPFTTGADFHPDGVYRLNVDNDGDVQADAAFTFVFSESNGGAQTGTVYYATGGQAREPEPVGEVLIEGTPVGFSLYNRLRIYDTVVGLILFHTAFGLPFAIFLLRNFFIGIPKDLMESARIDGASELYIFVRIILPLGLPAIASLGIFQFLWTWNDLLVALTLARSTQPITVAIFSQLRTFGSNIDIIAPATFVSLVIPLAVFFAFQRYFVQGLLAGSVK